MEQIVTGCGDCPFRGVDINSYYECKHPECENYIFKGLIKNSITNEYITPEGCPLNKEPIIIRKQTREDLYYKPGERYDFELCSDYGLKDEINDNNSR